jgi:hypothetical protein
MVDSSLFHILHQRIQATFTTPQRFSLSFLAAEKVCLATDLVDRREAPRCWRNPSIYPWKIVDLTHENCGKMMV